MGSEKSQSHPTTCAIQPSKGPTFDAALQHHKLTHLANCSLVIPYWEAILAHESLLAATCHHVHVWIVLGSAVVSGGTVNCDHTP